jgi:membrane protein
VIGTRIWEIEPFRLKELARRVWAELDADNVPGLAAQTSFYFTLALFPFLLFLAALVGGLPFTGLWDKILKWIVLYLPASSQRFIFDTVSGLTRGHTSFLSLGLLGTVWASCTGLMNLMCSLNTAYEVREGRSFLRRTGLALVMLFVFSFFFLGAFGLLTAGDWVDNWLAARVNPSLPLASLWHIGRWVVSLTLIALAVSLADHTLPNLKRPRRLITAGTLFVALAWVPASIGFNLYVRYVASYDKTYGALGAFVILMVWIYLGCLITLVGAEIDCELHKMSTEVKPTRTHQLMDLPDRNALNFSYRASGSHGPHP